MLPDNEKYKSYVEALQNALTFKIVFENNVMGDGLSYVTEGEIEDITIKFVNGSDSLYLGKGTGQYTEVTFPDSQVKFEFHDTFAVKAIIGQFKPCESDEFLIAVDAFGAKNETLITENIPINMPGVVHSMTAAAFRDKAISSESFLSAVKTDKVMYQFPMTLQNGQEVAANETFRGSMEAQIRYTLKLIHTPK